MLSRDVQIDSVVSDGRLAVEDLKRINIITFECLKIINAARELSTVLDINNIQCRFKTNKILSTIKMVSCTDPR